MQARWRTNAPAVMDIICLQGIFIMQATNPPEATKPLKETNRFFVLQNQAYAILMRPAVCNTICLMQKEFRIAHLIYLLTPRRPRPSNDGVAQTK